MPPVSARARSSTFRAASSSSDGGDHREHHPQRALGRDPADRPQLHLEQFRSLEPEAQSAAAQERVGLGIHRHRLQRLVGADIERAHDQRPVAQLGGDPGERLHLFVLGWDLGSLQEQELGP